MKSWSLKGIAESDRKHFIIQCLQEYIDEVEAMDARNSLYMYDSEIVTIADMYKAIIEELSA